MKNQKGITLIALVITIIVLLILAGVSISSLVGNNGVATKAKTAAEKFNNSKELELETLENIGSYIENASKIYSTMWTGTATGASGQLELPVSLNDCSKEYLLTVESTLYTGDVGIKVYGINETYQAFSGVSSEKDYIIELRLLTTNTSDVTELFEKENVAAIRYMSDGTANIVQYDAETLGSELTVTKIESADKKYTGFAEIAAKVAKQEKVKVKDALDCVKFCIDSGDLGYNYVNEKENTDALNEELEMSLLKDVYNNQVEKLETLEAALLDEIALLIHVARLNAITYIADMTGMQIDYYSVDDFTLIDWVQENEYLNEYYVRFLGNSVTPFTIIFNNAILTDLNDDGSLAQTTNFSTQDYLKCSVYPDTGYAGFQFRTFADYWAVLTPVMEKYEDVSQMTSLERNKLIEVHYVQNPDSNNSNGAIYNYFGSYAQSLLKVYERREMDIMYYTMYSDGITINESGLRLGWNSLIIPETFAYKFGMVSADYTFLKDTEHIKKQGIEHLKDDINEFIQNAILIDVSDIMSNYDI